MSQGSEAGLPSQFAVKTSKVTRYLLDVAHVEGGSKARFFLSFGFSATDPDAFILALLRHAVPEKLVRRESTVWGRKFVYEGALDTPDGRCPAIRSIWQTAPAGGEVGFLVSAYPI